MGHGDRSLFVEITDVLSTTFTLVDNSLLKRALEVLTWFIAKGGPNVCGTCDCS